MQSIQTSHIVPLKSVKPLEGLLHYRKFCLETTKRALVSGGEKRTQSPIDGSKLEPWAVIDGLEYYRCPKTGSLFLSTVATPKRWKALLEDLSQYRKQQAFHKEISQSRLENVYEPKKRWIENTLLLRDLQKPHVLEVTTPPSSFTALIKDEKTFGEILLVPEMELASEGWKGKSVDVAILLESLDRVNHPDLLLQNVYQSLNKGGLLFVTALVSSGFDMTILGKENAYLYPPDRANCFSLDGLKRILLKTGFELLEVSTPGVLDVEVVATHLNHGISVPLSAFERDLMGANLETKLAFQKFLQQSNMSSFARLVAVK